MENWTEELEKEFSCDQSKKTNSENGKKKKMSDKNINLIIIAFFLLIAVGLTYKNKISFVENFSKHETFSVNSEVKEDVEKLKKQNDNIDLVIKKIFEKSKLDSDRIALIATINNHNLSVIKKDLSKTELIFINDDWTIDRLPNQIRLDQNDQDFLKKFLRVK